MNNLEVAKMEKEEFSAAYEKAKATKKQKKPFNTHTLSLSQQIERFKSTSFNDAENKALDEDMQYI